MHLSRGCKLARALSLQPAVRSRTGWAQTKRAPGWRQPSSDLLGIPCQSAFATVHSANWAVWPDWSVGGQWHRDNQLVCAFGSFTQTRQSVLRVTLTDHIFNFYTYPCCDRSGFFFPFGSLSEVEWHSHAPAAPSPSPPATPLHLFPHSAGRPTPATEASAQVSRPGNPGPADKNALILYGPTFAKSGWVRAARGNSCLGSHQKKERDFFDYRPFVHPPLRLVYSLGLHSRGAASQCNGTLCALEISLNSCLCFKGNNSLVLLLLFLFFNVATSTFAGTEQHGTAPHQDLSPLCCHHCWRLSLRSGLVSLATESLVPILLGWDALSQDSKQEAPPWSAHVCFGSDQKPQWGRDEIAPLNLLIISRLNPQPFQH